MPFVSYARNFEDAILNRALGGQALGFYVDLGAGHPTFGSITRAFYARGWSGINVEPGSHFDELAAERPRDVNLRIAIRDHREVTKISIPSPDPGLGRSMAGAGDKQVSGIPCDTLEHILRDHAMGRPVDFLKIDSAASAAAVVKSTDWRNVRPRILVAGATLPFSNVLANADWEPVLIEAGYRHVYFDGISCFYVAGEHADALAHFFELPGNRLDGERFDGSVAGIAAARDAALVELGRERAALSRSKEDVARLALDSARMIDASESYRRRLEDLQATVREVTAEADRGRTERAACQGALDESRRERDDLARAYEAMARRADRLAGELAALRDAPRRSSADAIQPSGTGRPGTSGYSEIMGTLGRLREVPAAVEEIRRALIDGEVTAGLQKGIAEAPVLKSLAVEIERIMLTMAIGGDTGPMGEYEARPSTPIVADRPPHEE